ncbi:hypothetical protein F5I97DRAFT_1501810 [Phlebopus sp. FC_14]|nr:hypothetical protein F5I97DRAFT_1501810 [Phlebopus sp. FC_14]
MKLTLDAINDDTLVCIFAAVTIPDILTLRQVCRAFYSLSTQHTVWINACKRHILENDIPFPSGPLSALSAKDLEHQTLRAYKLGANWRSSSTQIHQIGSVSGKTGAIEQIKFLNNRGRNWIVTTSRGIWSNMYLRDRDTLQVVACWSPRKALFNGMTVNTDRDSEAAIAISIQQEGSTSVEILSIVEQGSSSDVTFHLINSVHTRHRPVTLSGDLVALSDHDSETLVLNWRTQERSILRSPDTWQDKPLHVVFVQGIVLVARARSICLFVDPPLVPPEHEPSVTLPYACSSFGWVDGVSLTVRPSRPLDINDPSPCLSMLVRTKGDDPWSLQDKFRFLTMNPETPRISSAIPLDGAPANHSPTQPLTLVTSLSCPHTGPLRCSDMVLGPYGTAVWVQPADWSIAGLISNNVHLQHVPVPSAQEILVAAIFPGRLGGVLSQASIKVSCVNSEKNWSCLDYDEELGLVALGSSSGSITMLRL